jgi:hypothetical protein
MREIHAVAWTVVNSHFEDPFAHRLVIAWVAFFQSIDSKLNSYLSVIVKSGEPSIELPCFPELDQKKYVANRLQSVKASDGEILRERPVSSMLSSRANPGPCPWRFNLEGREARL